jgi:hypothetical protein
MGEQARLFHWHYSGGMEDWIRRLAALVRAACRFTGQRRSETESVVIRRVTPLEDAN